MVSQHTGHDSTGHPEAFFGLHHSTVDAPQHRPCRYPTLRVCLSIDKHRGGAAPAGVVAGEIGGREPVEIVLGAQHEHVFVVQVKKTLQIVEPVPVGEVGFIAVGKRGSLRRRKCEDRRRFQRALNVQVKIAPGQALRSGHPRNSTCEGCVLVVRVLCLISVGFVLDQRALVFLWSSVVLECCVVLCCVVLCWGGVGGGVVVVWGGCGGGVVGECCRVSSSTAAGDRDRSSASSDKVECD